MSHAFFRVLEPLLRCLGPRRLPSVRRCVLLALALGVVVLQAQAGPASDGEGLQRIDAVEVQQSDGRWQPLALPDDWGQRGVPRPGTQRYRVEVQVPDDARSTSARAAPWALWSARLPMHHRILVDGAIVSDTLLQPDALQPRTTPKLVQLPPLSAGRHVVEIEELGGLRAGLGSLWLGPAAAVSARAQAYLRVWVDTSRGLNGMAGGAALFALVLWARRRSEVAMGWFGLLVLILSMRNIALVEPGVPSPPGASFVMLLLVCVCNALFTLFAHSMGRRSPDWMLRLMLAVPLGTAAMASFYAVTAPGPAAQDQLRMLVYPVLSTVSALAALRLGAGMSRLPRNRRLPIAASGVLFAVSGVYDFLLHTGRLPQHWEYLLPWTSPLLALSYAAMLGGRLVHALHESERAGQVLEQRVRERTSALEAANATKTRFLAAASHDLRQPMVTIGVLIGVLREQLASPAQQRLVARVDEAVAAMESLLAGLLDLSRLEGDGLRVRQDSIALGELLHAVAAHEQEAAAAKGLQLRLRVPAGARVLGDGLLVEQVLRNLVVNALRYTDRGGVLVAVRSRSDRWCIAVYDTGRGIDPLEHARVFEDFVQLENPQRQRSQGLGLGLAIVRRAAAVMGTRIQLRSTLGRGSCFSFELPKAGAPADASSDRLGNAATVLTPRLEGRRLWLVEDDDGVRAALVERLSHWGANVLAVDTLSALLAQDEGPPALLITDMRLPGDDGLAVVAAVRERHGPVPALIVTGNTSPDDLALLAASGLPVLHKPFRAEQLAAALAPLLPPVPPRRD